MLSSYLLELTHTTATTDLEKLELEHGDECKLWIKAIGKTYGKSHDVNLMFRSWVQNREEVKLF